MRTLVLVSVMLFLVSGCSTLSNVVENHEAKVRIAIMLAIQSGTKDRVKWQSRAKKTLREVKRLDNKLFDLEKFTVLQVREYLEREIVKQGMSPVSTIMFQELLPVIEKEIQVDINTGLIKPDTRVTLKRYLTIAEQAARVYL